MKRWLTLLLVCLTLLSMTSCAGRTNEKPVQPTSEPEAAATEAPVQTDPEPVTPEPEPVSRYGSLQGLVDTYGFPITLRMTEGMELTYFEISEDSAFRYWTSSNQQTKHENLTWSIDGTHLEFKGDWEESFTITDTDIGRAVSESTGKVYQFAIYDQDGDVVFFVPDP